MSIEKVIRHILPQGMTISDDIRDTAPKELIRNDFVAALQFTEKDHPLGAALFNLKINATKPELEAVRQMLITYCEGHAPTNLRKNISENQFSICMQVLSKFAISAYIARPESGNHCLICNGSGFMQFSDTAQSPAVCEGCKGKGSIFRCRCGGTGLITRRIDKRRTAKGTGNTCTKCNGNGFAQLKAANLRRAMASAGTNIKADSFGRHWWPFFNNVLEAMRLEERKASKAFEEVTK